jgi:hypothetical protein
MEELSKVTTIYKDFKSFDDKGKVIVNTESGSYSFFRNKKDGTPTKALETLKELSPKEGDGIVVFYKENGKYKNAVVFYRPKEGDVPAVAPKSTGELEARITALEERVAKLESTPKDEYSITKPEITVDEIDKMFNPVEDGLDLHISQ